MSVNCSCFCFSVHTSSSSSSSSHPYPPSLSSPNCSSSRSPRSTDSKVQSQDSDKGCRSIRQPFKSFFISDILHGNTDDTSSSSSSCSTDRPEHPWPTATLSSPGTRWNDRAEEEDEDEEEIVVDDVVTRASPSVVSSLCPLRALLRMTSETMDNKTNSNAFTDDETRPRDVASLPGLTKTHLLSKKRRKSRTAFTNQQIYELEKRFLCQKYVTSTDRDQIASSLGMTNSQVITWFQNRRAKLKRDLEELKADVTAAKTLGTEPSSSVLAHLEELLQATHKPPSKRKGDPSAATARKDAHHKKDDRPK